MNDTANEVRKKHRDEASVTEREDNYLEYLRDEYGYSYRYSEVKTSAELSSHYRLIESDKRAEEINLDKLTDFDRLAIAKRCMQNESPEKLKETIDALIESPRKDPGVEYTEVAIDASLYFLRHGDLTEAEELISKHLQIWEDELEGKIIEGLVTYLADDDETTLETLADKNPADPELRLDIVEIAIELDQIELAHRWLDRAEKTTSELEAEPASVDIELFREKIT